MLDNAGIAKLLIREAETATGHRERALQRAATRLSCGRRKSAGAPRILTLAQVRKVLGGGTISEMAAAAIERGYKFIAITDHTQGLKIAGGLEIYAREPLEK